MSPISPNAMRSVLLVLVATTACWRKNNEIPAPVPVPRDPAQTATSGESSQSRQEVERLRLTLRAAAEDKSRLERALEERSHQLISLEEAYASLELELASALEELLRSQTNLRNVQSRAFAVSRIAEVRVELDSTRAAGDAAARDRLTRADDFLDRADTALGGDNVGGAIYLAERASELVRQARTMVEMRRRVSSEMLPIVPPRKMEVLATANLRKGPGSDEERVGLAAPGETVTALARQGEWYQVETKNGVRAWIHRGLIQ